MLQWLLIFIAGLLLGNYIRRKKRSSMLSTAPAQPLPNAGEIHQSPGTDGHRIMSLALENFRKYGYIYCVWIFEQLAIASIDPRLIFGQQAGSESSLAALPAIAERDMPYAQAILRVTNMPTVQFLKPLLSSLLDRRNEVLILTLHDFMETVMGQRREAASPVPSTLQLYDELGQKRLGQTWLEELIQATLSICEKEDDDTNCRGNTLCLYEISEYPSVQQGEGDEDKARSMPALEYLECVHPPTPETIFDSSLKENMDIRGKLIPLGTNLIVGIYALLRDPHEYEAYHKLHKHDKQSQQKQLKPYKINPFAHILAFAAGPSNCIGHKYAGLQMKCVISRVLQNYKLQPLPLRPASSTHMPPLPLP